MLPPLGIASAVAALAVALPATAQAPDDAVMARSLLDRGDTARLEHVMAKARRGEPVTLAVIGGSITAGASATTEDRRYGNRIAAWWRERFPNAKVTFVNAGIGATGSDYGAQRAQRDLLVHKPDLVVVEYGVNDGDAQPFAETLEGLVRQILKQPQKPAVVLLFMMNDHGGNAQAWHSKVGKHYGLPMVSYRDALWPEMQAGRMELKEAFADLVHPNDRGHQYVAEFVAHLFDEVLRSLPPDGRLPRIAALPKPLFTDLFEHARLWDAGTLQPVRNEGWAFDAREKCWRADRPGSVVEFEVPGQLVFLQTFRLRGAMGRAKVQVDDHPPVTIEGWFDQTWGGYHPTTIVGRDLPKGKHRVRVELLEDKQPESTGHEFRLYEIGAAG